MLNLKFLLQCCCDSKSNEEEKVEKLNNSKSDLKSHTNPQSALYSEGRNHDESIVAAPFPLQGIDTMAYPKLLLRIIESTSLPSGTVLKINASGLENSKRGKSDFKTFIGSQLCDKGEIINDFVINEEAQGMGKQHLLIKFNLTSNRYTISDLGDGTGTFVKISNDLLLKDGYIISFGNSHMKISANAPGLVCDDKLSIKFLEGPKSGEEFFFSPHDDLVLIGRMTDCRIKFEDSNMSRYQCNIVFHQGRGWVLRDGANSKNSTNGTWIYVEEEFEIVDKMLFKAGKTLFEASLEEKC